MAQIREYNRQVDAVGPIQGREVSAESLGGGGRALEFAGKALGHVAETIDKVQSQDDVIEGSKQTSEFYLRQTQKLEDLKISGKIAEDGAIQKYQEEFDNEFSGMSETMKTSTGKKFMAERQASYSQHFGASFIKQSAEARGMKAKAGYTQILANKGNALVTNPDAFENTLKDMQQTTNALRAAGTMEASAIDELQRHSEEQLAIAAIQGHINKNPSYAKGLVDAGYYDKFIPPEKKSSLLNSIDTNIRGRRTEELQLKKLEQEAKNEAGEAEAKAMLPQIYANKGDMDAILSPKSMMSRTLQEHMIGLINRTATGTARNNPAMENKVFIAIHNNQINSTEELFKYVGEGLDGKGYERMQKVLDNRKDPTTGMSDSKSLKALYEEASQTLMSKTFGIKDPDGQARLNDFNMGMHRAFEDGRKRGLTSQQMFNRNSPDWLGHAIKTFTPTAQQKMDANMRGLSDNKANGYTSPVVFIPPPNPNIPAAPTGGNGEGGLVGASTGLKTAQQLEDEAVQAAREEKQYWADIRAKVPKKEVVLPYGEAPYDPVKAAAILELDRRKVAAARAKK